MANGEQTVGHNGDIALGAPSPSVVDLRITVLEQQLRGKPAPTPEEASELRTRLASLYLVDLGDPLGATVHVEELLAEETVGAEALDLALRLLDVKTVAARIAKGLSAAYGRIGRTADEAAVLTRELALAKGARLDEVRMRLVALRMDALGDPDGALELLEPLVARDAGNDALRERFVEVARSGGQTLRAIKVLSRALSSQKDPESKARVAHVVGCLWRAQGDTRRAVGSFMDALGTQASGDAVVASAGHLLELDPGSSQVRAVVLETMARLGRSLDSPALSRAALLEIDFLAAMEQREPALDLCRRALDGLPGSTDLMERFEDLAEGRVLPDERRRRLARAVPLIERPEARRAAMHRWAQLEARELANLPAALEIWRRILAEDPADQKAEEALVEAYEQTGDREALQAEIDHALETFEGAFRHGLLLRKARLLGRQGEREGALSTLAELLALSDLEGPIIESLAEVAYDEDDPELYQRALERQAALEDPVLRVRALERLGDFRFERLGDARAAIESWKPAARLVAQGGNGAEDGQHAEELYERVLQASPDDSEAAEHLLRLYVKSDRWVGIAEVYAVLLRAGGEAERITQLLLDLEESATRAGAVDDFVSMIDEAIPVTCAEGGPLLHRLMRAKARALSVDHARQEAASRAHRDLVASSGQAEDVRAFRAFIDAMASADERQDDLRWWFAFQAERADEPVPVLVEWAKAEEDYGDVDAAIAVHERIVQEDPTRADALRALARLAAGSGDFEKSLGALQGLRERISPELAGEIDLHMARILVEHLARPLEAANLVVPLLGQPPVADRALEILLLAASVLPAEPELWDAVRRSALERNAPELLVRAFRRAVEREHVESAQVEAIGKRVVEAQDECSADVSQIIETLEAVLEHAPAARWALDRVKLVLSSTGRWNELFDRYDRAIEAAPTDPERADLLDEAGIVAKDLAGQSGRAIRYLEILRTLRPDDARVAAILERLCEREGEIPKLVALLSERALSAAPPERSLLDQRIARLWLELGDVVRARDVVGGLLEREAPVSELEPLLERIVRTAVAGDGRIDDPEPEPALQARGWAVALLERHYADEVRISEWVRVTEAKLTLLGQVARRAVVAQDLVRLRMRAEGDAAEPFLRVLPRAAEDAGGEWELEGAVLVALLELAKERLDRLEGSDDQDAARAAWWVLHLLVQRRLSEGEHAEAADLLVECARLPFGRARQRELLGRAASLFAGPAAIPDRALALLRDLFHEDAGDEVAQASVTRFTELLVDAGLDVERALLSERLARARSLAGAPSEASELWTHAATLWEELRDTPRALSAHSESAALGSHASVEAVARLHEEQGDLRAASQALEWALQGRDDERVALALARLYERLGDWSVARARLEEAVSRGPGRPLLQERLASLYRREELWGPLALLLATSAAHIEDPDSRFQALREAIDIELQKRGNPEGAIPLLRAALALRPEAALEAALAEALETTERFEEAAVLLRSQLAAFEGRRPKQRALIHHRLARVLLRSGDRPGSLAELGAAVAIDPTDPASLHDLGRLALEDGDLDVADRSFRSLLLAVHHGAHAEDAPGKVEIYLSLGDVATQKGNLDRANELSESAFAAALESRDEASRLEEMLEARGQSEMLARAIERRLVSATGSAEKVSALVDLVRVHLSAGAVDHGAVIARLEEHIPTVKKGDRRRLRLELARLRLASPGEGPAAVVVLQALVAEDPADLEAVDLLGTVLEREGKDEALVELLSARLQTLGDAAEPQAFVAVASRLSAVLERVGRPEAALPLYEALSSIDGLDVATLMTTLERLEALGSREVGGTLERLIQRSTGRAAAELAARLLALRDAEGDGTGIARALALGFAADPSDTRFRDRFIRGLTDRGATAEAPAALHDLEGALALAPGHPGLLSARAAVHEMLGSDDLAVLDLEQGAAKDPSLASALVALLGRVVSRGASPRLDDHTLRLIDLSPSGDRAAALGQLDRLLERDPDHAPALERRAALLLGSGDVHGAVATYRRLLPLIRADGSTLARAAAAFADACERVGRSTDAREALEEARRLAPDGRELRKRLEAVYEAAGESSRLADLLLEDAAEASAEAERAALLRRAAGLLLGPGGNMDRALHTLEEARRAEPDHPEGLLLLAQVWTASGRAVDALRLLTEWTETKKSKSGPVASRVYLSIASLRLQTDDLFEAFDALERSFTHDPRNVQACLLLALVAIDLDDEKTATRALRAIVASRTDKVAPDAKAVAYFHLAELATRRGDPRSARVMATHAITENPSHEGARALLDGLG